MVPGANMGNIDLVLLLFLLCVISLVGPWQEHGNTDVESKDDTGANREVEVTRRHHKDL